MSKERIKSLVLVCLVMVNFILGARILSDKKLWPYGYNFFSSFGNSGFLRAITSGSDIRTSKTMLTMPQEIIVNTGDQTSRVAVTSDEEIFSEICDSASGLIAEALKAKEEDIHHSSKNEWTSELSGKSICFNYHTPHDTRVFADLFGSDADSLFAFVPSIERVIVSADKSVYFENFENGEFYRVRLNKNFDKISTIISDVRAANSDNRAIINYSVDLKFDETFGGQKAILSSAVPVYSSAVKLPSVTAQNPLTDENGVLKKEVVDKILLLFKINTGTVRRYPEVDGTVVFVENNGILKINPRGIISYHSTGSEGLVIASGREAGETAAAAVGFASEVNSACSIKNRLFSSSPITPDSSKFIFDYTASGIPVRLEQGNAVEVETRDGGIVSYRHIVKNYIPSTGKFEAPQYIDALDDAIEYYSKDMNGIEISKIYTSYTDDGTDGAKYADWRVEIKSIELEAE